MSNSKVKKKLDAIVEMTQERVGTEIGGLMGATLTMSEFSTRLISKEDFFDEPSGKLIFSELQLSGEIEGDGCILISIKDAIRLGGTLIMLPESELVEVVAAEDYNEELEDSYGEIANLIAGAYTSTFEEMYPKKFRFIRKEQEIIVPAKVDVESDKPIPNQNYYQVTAGMTLNDVEMGKLILLLPAASLGVDDEAPAPTEKSDSTSDSPVAGNAEEETGDTNQENDSAASVQTPTAKPVDIKKQKKLVDACLDECCKCMGGEIGAMLGTDVTFSDHEIRVVNKEDFFFDDASGKQVLAYMDVVGDIEGKSYLYIGLKEAIIIGGTLIMLPESEIERLSTEEEFGEDAEDAYGEIANIMSGVYTRIFEEQYRDKIRFIKTGLELIVPMKVDTEADEPMPDIAYYMSSSQMSIGDTSYGKLQFLVPTSIFKLEQLGEAVSADEETANVEATQKGVSGSTDPDGSDRAGVVSNTNTGGDGSERAGVVAAGEGVQNPEILLVSNDENACSEICSVLEERGVAFNILDYKDSVGDYLPGEVKAVFLVMTEVDEKGLGVAIKISSASSLPLIAAGPGWTKTKVIKAVKYGVGDILLTPASSEDIVGKIDSVLAKMAA